MEIFLAVLALVALLGLVPGAAVVLVEQSVMASGGRSALAAAGVLVADLIWVAAAVGGVAAVLVGSGASVIPQFVPVDAGALLPLVLGLTFAVLGLGVGLAAEAR